MRPLRLVPIAAALAAAIAGAPATQSRAAVPHPAFEFLGTLVLPNRLKIGATEYGGVSGLAYVPARREWLGISDDKSEHGAARVYGMTVVIADGHLAGLRIRRTITLRRPDGTPFPPPPPGSPTGENAPNSVDGEAVAYAADTGTMFWSSESNWATNRQPSVTESRLDGRFLRALPTPQVAIIDAARTHGARDNGDFETLCLSADKRSLWVGIEQPLLQDGPLPTDTAGATLRLIRIDRASGAVLAQYAYPVAPRPGGPANGRTADGPALVECAALPDGRLLTLERGYLQGVGNPIQIFLTDPSAAEDIKDIDSLAGKAPRPVAKTLVLDMKDTQSPIDNFEGMALGPALPDGRRLMLMSSDDNFSLKQKNLLAAFAVDLSAFRR